MNARVFGDFVGAEVYWQPVNQTVTITGRDINNNPVVVVMTIGNPTATVNGNPVDIATGAGQSQFAGRISPVIERDRSFVPTRFLANQFMVDLDWNAGSATTTLQF